MRSRLAVSLVAAALVVAVIAEVDTPTEPEVPPVAMSSDGYFTPSDPQCAVDPPDPARPFGPTLRVGEPRPRGQA